MATSSFLQAYDLALRSLLYEKFGSYLSIPDLGEGEDESIRLGVLHVPRDIAQRVAAERRGKTFLEFINFWRTETRFSWERQRTPVARRGLWLNYSSGTKVATVHAKAVPVNLSYSAWFWSVDRDKVYDCINEYMFWLHNSPRISLTFNDVYSLEPYLKFSEAVDESTVPSQFQKGAVHVFRMPIVVEGWLVDSDSFGVVHKIRLTFYDKNEVTNYEDIIVEDSDQDTELEQLLRMFRQHLYAILGVSTSGKYFEVYGDRTSDFSVGDRIEVQNSTGNDGSYVIVAVSEIDLGGGESKTRIVVTESVPSAVADGTLFKGE